MPFLTSEMVAPQMTAAQQTRHDSTRRALAEGGAHFESRPARQPRGTGRLQRRTVRLGYRVTRPGGCRLLFITAIAVAAPAAAAAPASATPGSAVNGTFTTSPSTMTSTRTVGGNTFVTFARTPSFSGTISGTASDTATVVFHPDGTTSVNGQGTCLCSVDGRTGTIHYNCEAGASLATDLQLIRVEQHLLDRGTGGLAGLHLEGPWTANVGWATVSTSRGAYHFDQAAAWWLVASRGGRVPRELLGKPQGGAPPRLPPRGSRAGTGARRPIRRSPRRRSPCAPDALGCGRLLPSPFPPPTTRARGTSPGTPVALG